uniref:Uncharacterized protein n=1 Tax=Knipowitschia caucasica TaxID=637954 RepID=A0AAV2LY95_KNICA
MTVFGFPVFQYVTAPSNPLPWWCPQSLAFGLCPSIYGSFATQTYISQCLSSIAVHWQSPCGSKGRTPHRLAASQGANGGQAPPARSARTPPLLLSPAHHTYPHPPLHPPLATASLWSHLAAHNAGHQGPTSTTTPPPPRPPIPRRSGPDP